MKLVSSSGNNNRRRKRQPARREREEYEVRDYVRGPEEESCEDSTEDLQYVIHSYRKHRRLKLLSVFMILITILAAGYTAYSVMVVAPEMESGGLAAAVTDPGTGDDPGVVFSGGDVTYSDTGTGRKEYCHTFIAVGRDMEGTNTDTIMVGMFDTKNGEINVVSIPRDTLVNVSWGTKKVNTLLYNADDVDEFLDWMSSLLGYKIDNYAIVNLVAFQKLIDAVGGVYYDVPMDMDYDDPGQDLYIHIPAGYQWLDGYNALCLMRYREGYEMQDIGRIGTQQDFLKSVAKQMLTIGNIPNIDDALAIFEAYVKTDLTYSNMAWYAKEFLQMDSSNIHFYTMPGDYSCYINGVSYVSVIVDEWVTMLNDCLNPYYEQITERNLSILQCDSETGEVYTTNGTPVAGGENSFSHS